jgi:hypothetical protein
MSLHRGSKLLWNLYLKLKLFWFLLIMWPWRFQLIIKFYFLQLLISLKAFQNLFLWFLRRALRLRSMTQVIIDQFLFHLIIVLQQRVLLILQIFIVNHVLIFIWSLILNEKLKCTFILFTRVNILSLHWYFSFLLEIIFL